MRDIGGQRVRERLLLVGHDLRIERMHVAHQAALLVCDVGEHAVVRVRARDGRVSVARKVRQHVVLAEVQQCHVAPEAGVIFLRVQQHDLAAARGVGIRAEVRDVGHALFLVDDQVLTTSRSSARACSTRCCGVLR
jgi:hypothetical protein